MRAPSAGLAVLGVALIASTVRAQDDEVLRVVSIDMSQPLAPSIVLTVPDLLAGQVLPAGAFSAHDDRGPRPISVENLTVGDLDVGLVIDTAADLPVTAVGEQQATAVEVLRNLQSGGDLGISTSTASSVQLPTPGHSATYSFLAGLRSEGDRHMAAGIRKLLDHFRSDSARRRAIVVMSAGDVDLTTSAETVLLAEDMTTRAVQVFWLVMDGTAPPIVHELAASGQPVTLIEGKSAAAAADQVVSALKAQYRVSIDLTGAVGPVRLRADVNGAVHEVPVSVATLVPPSTTQASATQPAAEPNRAAPVATMPAVPTTGAAAAPIVTAPMELNARQRTAGVVEINGGTSATWWALIAFASLAARRRSGWWSPARRMPSAVAFTPSRERHRRPDTSSLRSIAHPPDIHRRRRVTWTSSLSSARDTSDYRWR